MKKIILFFRSDKEKTQCGIYVQQRVLKIYIDPNFFTLNQ